MTRPIAELLQGLNRKERYWVVKEAFGGQVNHLSATFCQRLRCTLGEKIGPIDPAKAWWAMDYHFDWLFTALYAYQQGLTLHELAGRDQLLPPNGLHGEAIQGHTEDIDFIVVHDRDVILLEAKVFGAWGNVQVASKLRRLASLTAALQDTGKSVMPELRLHFALWSPKPPQKLKGHDDWEPWLNSTRTPHHLDLTGLGEADFFEVTLPGFRARNAIALSDADTSAVGAQTPWRLRKV